MEELAIIFVLFLLFAIIFSFVMSIILKGNVNDLRMELREIKERLNKISSGEVKEDRNAINAVTREVSQIIPSKEQEDEIKEEEIKEEEIALQEEEEEEETFQEEQEEELKEEQEYNKEVYASSSRRTDSGFDKALSSIGAWVGGGNFVAKVAVIILFFGLSFLLKYSIDNGILSPELRVLLSGILGFVLIAIGLKLRKSNETFSLILQGGGIGVLYLTTFACVKIYEMIPTPIAFMLLVALCGISVVFALSQRALSLAIVSFTGAYLAPVLLSDGSGNHKILFTFYVFVSLAILVISKWRSWRILNLLGFLFTFIVFYSWMLFSYEDSFYMETQIFIIANLIIFGVLTVILFIRSERNSKFYTFIDVFMLFGTPLLSYFAQYNITSQWEFGPAFGALGFGAFYVIGTFIIFRAYRDKTIQILYYGLGLALSFATLAVPLALSNNLTSLVWMLEGSAITYVSLRNKQIKLGFVGLAITVFGALFALRYESYYILPDLDFLLLYGLMSAIILFNACIFYHFQALHKNFRITANIILFFAAFSWVGWIFGGVLRVVPEDFAAILVVFTIAVWLWYFIGKRQNFLILKYAVISLWPMLILCTFSDFADFSQKTFWIWELGWPLALFSAYFYLYLQKDSESFARNIKIVLHISLLWVVFGYIYNKAEYLLGKLIPYGYYVVEHSLILSLFCALVVIIYFLRKRGSFPFDEYKKEYWSIGLVPCIFYIVCSLLVGSILRGSVPGLIYIPFLNPLELSALFGLIVISFYFSIFQKERNINLYQQRNSVFVSSIVSILIFMWANSILLRVLSNLFAIPWNFDYLWDNNLIQVSLSIFWTLIALFLLVYANKKSARTVWFVGAILLTIVVIKLILLDSVTLQGLMRAFSFIGVALLMLLIGYLAPIPPKIDEDEN